MDTRIIQVIFVVIANGTQILTPCVNTAGLSCSSIASSSSSVVARPVISSCRSILFLHRSRQSVWVRLYSVITSTNLRDSVECWVFLILRSADDLFECSSCSMFCSISVDLIIIVLKITVKNIGNESSYHTRLVSKRSPFWTRCTYYIYCISKNANYLHILYHTLK